MSATVACDSRNGFYTGNRRHLYGPVGGRIRGLLSLRGEAKTHRRIIPRSTFNNIRYDGFHHTDERSSGRGFVRRRGRGGGPAACRCDRCRARRGTYGARRALRIPRRHGYRRTGGADQRLQLQRPPHRRRHPVGVRRTARRNRRRRGGEAAGQHHLLAREVQARSPSGCCSKQA